ncbi:MAG: hypothetical protein Q9188_004157 [Gyalolechia gomerana]
MAQVVPSEEEALAWSSLTPAPQIPPRAATRPTGSTTAIADALAGLAPVNPCDPQVVNHFRRVPPVVGLNILIQAEREWVAARRSDGNFWSAWKAHLQQHLLVSGTFCQNPTLELEDIEWIIEQYGSQRLLRVLEEDTVGIIAMAQTEEQPEPDQPRKAGKMNELIRKAERPIPVEEVGLKVIIWVAQGMFMDRSTYPDSTYDHAFKTGKKILRASARHDNKTIRQLLAENYDIWTAYIELLSVALPSLESRSFSSEDPNASSAALIAANYAVLMKDLERINDLLLIARNILATTALAQNIAGDSGIVQMVIKLIEICVRVTARGYDGEAGARINEAQWRNIIDAYKKLLITSLQFLHNAVQRNEKRKLLLWLDLFANSRSSDQYYPGEDPSRKDGSTVPEIPQEAGLLSASPSQARQEAEFAGDILVSNAIELVQKAKKAGTNETREMHPDEAARLTSQVMDTVEGMVSMTLEQNKRDAVLSGTTSKNGESGPLTFYDPTTAPSLAQSWCSLPDLALNTDLRGNGAIKPEDTKCLRTPQSAAVVLQQAKDQLMARLRDDPEEDGEQRPVTATTGNGEDGGSDVAAESIDNNDDDDDYRTNDQERGLLTDVPLVLGPQEIEALPMMIQGGIVPSLATKDKDGRSNTDMQSVRCNILLAQEAGRNLLRELLIFIAAWDLPEEELYFKLMIQIMEAILANGLMPFAYQAFGEVKDIVSPAQSMVIKILTQIFRTKQGLVPMTNRGTIPNKSQRREPPTRVDLLVIRYIFTVFRQCIIPETCALIYLQGQIRAGHCLPEDFPLNLWDMERVYEGVYQFLEFFAVLTESEDWKGLLVNWEIVSELVTLLRELDASIPKSPLGPIPSAAAATEALGSASSAMQEPQTNNEPSSSSVPVAPVAVERPYDSLPIDGPLATTNNGTGSVPTAATTSYQQSEPASPCQGPGIDSQDPSDFEWRNLKKLVVLVLSSLVWKSPTVQNQIRAYGGVEMILACCNFDANNPYIREHAIMCLRFLLEGNMDNQSIVENLKPRGAIENTNSSSAGDGGVEGRERGRNAGNVVGGGGVVTGSIDEENVRRLAAQVPRMEVKDVLQAFGEDLEKVEEMLLKRRQ